MVTRIGAALLTSVCLLAQEQPTLRTNVPLVLVPVTVTNSKGGYVEGLRREDFTVTDDGAAQRIQLDTSDTVLAPVALVIAIQSSGIAEPALAKIRQVGSMMRPLVMGDRGQAAVIAYDSEVRVLAEFTGESDKIQGAIGQVRGRSIKQGRMLDAVAKAVEILESRPENFRRVILLIGESRDRGSKLKLPKTLELVQRANVAIYPATYSAMATAFTARPEDNPPMPGGMDIIGGLGELARKGTANMADAFARATGGRHLSFATLDGLENDIGMIGEEIHSQYLLSFVPMETPNHGFHKLEVRVASHPEAVVRARPGYWP